MKEIRRENYPDDASWHKAASALSVLMRPRQPRPQIKMRRPFVVPETPLEVNRRVFDAEYEARRALPCTYRGAMRGKIGCGTCGGNKDTAVYACSKHTICTLTHPASDRSLAYCRMCKERSMGYNEIPFESFKNRFAGHVGVVIGKGTTDFNYEDLALESGPVFFINDAVWAEQYVRHDNRFLFAQDKRQAVHLDCKSLPVMKIGGLRGTLGYSKDDPAFVDVKRICFYRHAGRGNDELLVEDRDQLAIEQRLYRGRKQHGSTIMPVIHFAWFTGVAKLRLIGCDGLPVGYDVRIPNRSNSPAPEGVGDFGVQRFANFRVEADRVMGILGVQAEYVGAPDVPCNSPATPSPFQPASAF